MIATIHCYRRSYGKNERGNFRQQTLFSAHLICRDTFHACPEHAVLANRKEERMIETLEVERAAAMPRPRRLAVRIPLAWLKRGAVGAWKWLNPDGIVECLEAVVDLVIRALLKE